MLMHVINMRARAEIKQTFKEVTEFNNQDWTPSVGQSLLFTWIQQG